MGKHQKVVLIEDVPTLGQRGELVQVRAGYARNYLIPQGLAVPATPSVLKELEQFKQKLTQSAEQARAAAEQMKATIESEPLVIQRRTGREDLLFEAVTRDVIAEALAARGLQMNRRQIRLDQPLKRAGHYEILIHLHEDINATLTLKIEPIND